MGAILSTPTPTNQVPVRDLENNDSTAQGGLRNRFVSTRCARVSLLAGAAILGAGIYGVVRSNNPSDSVCERGAGVYGGGPFYKSSETIDDMRASGFSWTTVWTIHLDNTKGDMTYNGEFPLIQNGTYIGHKTHPNFADDMAMLKASPSSIKRVEAGLGASASRTFDIAKDLLEAQGTGPHSILYKNFKTLKDTVPAIDAISFNDESLYDRSSTTRLAIMLADIGFKVSIAPYRNMHYWASIVSETNLARPGTIEDVHLQCYAGGAGNDPCKWKPLFPPEVNVMPGVFQDDDIQKRMSKWGKECDIPGGWIWIYDDFEKGTTSDKASAISGHCKDKADRA